MVAFGFHTVGIALRWIESYRLEHGTRAALKLLRISHILCLVYYSPVDSLMKKRLQHPSITSLRSLMALFLMGFASISPSVEKEIQPLVPALQSNWLHIHVATCFIAYAAFAISFIAGVTLPCRAKRAQFHRRDVLEEINYKCIIIGFPMLTSGILTGAVWAQLCVGLVLELGPKGNVVAYNVDHIRPLSPRENDERMERQDERYCIDCRVFKRYG